jgi:hypothetical protein
MGELMPKPARRPAGSSAIAKRLKEQSKRQKRIIEDAVISAAMAGHGSMPKRVRETTPRLQSVAYITTEAAVDATEAMIENWAEGVRLIELKYGKGFFPLRLEHAGATSVRFIGGSRAAARATTVLSVLTTMEKDPDPVFALMQDLMFAMGLPEARIKAEAGGRGSLWDKRLRHTKAGKSALKEKQFRERRAEEFEDPHLKRLRHVDKILDFKRPPWTKEHRGEH